MKIACCCCTYKRPDKLGRALESFLRQDYPDCFLVILDDAGQYMPQGGDRWQLFTTTHRFPNLGAKRNHAAAIADDHGADAVMLWDDDDVYLPTAVSATADALAQGLPAVTPSYRQVPMQERNGALVAEVNAEDLARPQGAQKAAKP